MPREGYIKELRRHVGTMPLFMPSVAVLIRDGERVLVGLHRDVGQWVVPGGALEPDELPVDCAVREVWEETGLHVRVTALHGVYAGTPHHRIQYPNGDIVDYVATVFEAEVIGGALADATEELGAFRWVSASELAALDAPGWMAPMIHNPGWEPGTWSPHR